MVGQVAGYLERLLLPSMHCSPTPLLRSTEFWFDRYENNLKKKMLPCIQNPEPMALFGLTNGETLYDRGGWVSRAMGPSS